jgi:hypothetical protein
VEIWGLGAGLEGDDGRPVPPDAAVGPWVAIGATSELATGELVAWDRAAGLGVPPGAVVATGVGSGVGRGVGRAVGVGVGVDVAHVPAGDTGGGSAPPSGSYRNPTSSPSATVAFDTPCEEFAHAPPPREMKNTQYEPEDGRHWV